MSRQKGTYSLKGTSKQRIGTWQQFGDRNNGRHEYCYRDGIASIIISHFIAMLIGRINLAIRAHSTDLRKSDRDRSSLTYREDLRAIRMTR